MVVALAPPASPANVNGVQVIYVTMSGSGSGTPPVGVFVSTDQGATWTQQTATGVSGTTYNGYALHMAVDPASPGDGINDIIYFGCLNQFKSIDSGTTFTSLSVGHADTHTWTLVPQSGGASSVVYCGCDGGIDVSTDGGATWTPLNGGGLQTGLFYNIAVKPDASASVTVGALQDNELQTTAGASGLGWTATFGGDGWDVAYDGSSASGFVRHQRRTKHRRLVVHRRRRQLPDHAHSAVDLGGHRWFLLDAARGRPQCRGHDLCERSPEPLAASGRDLAQNRDPGHERQCGRGPHQRQQRRDRGAHPGLRLHQLRWRPPSGRLPASRSPTSPGTSLAATWLEWSSIPLTPPCSMPW